jgi:hypothetical protein
VDVQSLWLDFDGVVFVQRGIRHRVLV